MSHVGRLEGVRGLVTGGASGIGRAIVEAFVHEGARVVVVDSDGDAAHRLAEDVADIIAVEADVSDADAMAAAYGALDEQLGGLDVVVACAGIAAVGDVEEVTPAEFDRAVSVNLRGSFLTAQLGIPRLRSAGGGSIVFISSNAGLVARAHDPVYGATKAAQIQMMRSLALSLARDRIRVNAVCPGPVDTPGLWTGVAQDALDDALASYLYSVPLGRALGRVAHPAEVAAAVVFLVSREASYVTGVALPVDGGKTAGLQVGADTALDRG